MFPVRFPLPAMCRREQTVGIAQLMSKCMEARGNGKERLKR